MAGRQAVAMAALGAIVLMAVAMSTGSSRTELVGSQMQQELQGCMQLAKVFKGTKMGQRKVTEAQKIEAMRCMQVIKMAHSEGAQTGLAQMKNKKGAGKETCNCCAFAGCPCCQPAMHAPVTQQLTAVKHTKKPFFHREGKFAKKHLQLLKMKRDTKAQKKTVNPISWDIGYVAAHAKDPAARLGFKF